MTYKNAKNMLPAWLVEKLQEYVQGEAIYIPKKEEGKSGWGEANGTRDKYLERNREIWGLFRNGAGINELAQKYHLSEYSIKKIVCGMKHQVRPPALCVSPK